MPDIQILLFAKNGQLGWELNRSLLALGNVLAVGASEVDFEDADALAGMIRETKPAFIINPAAYTAVDQAESETERAGRVNSVAPGVLAKEAKKINAILIHYSTDYVFDGLKGVPYDESDPVQPLNVYGRSKLEGERAIAASGAASLVLRTSWVYSLRQQGGFVNKVLQWSRQQTQLRMVTDQVGNPTWARMLAEVTAILVSRGASYLRERQGLYHLAGRGFTSRFNWGSAVMEFDPNKQEQTATKILPALTSEFPAAAARPLFSALNCDTFEKTFDLKLADWKAALKLAMS